MAHEKVNEEAWSTLDGYFHTVVCSCREIFEGGPKQTPEGAKTAAYTGFGLHMHGG